MQDTAEVEKVLPKKLGRALNVKLCESMNEASERYQVVAAQLSVGGCLLGM